MSFHFHHHADHSSAIAQFCISTPLVMYSSEASSPLASYSDSVYSPTPPLSEFLSFPANLDRFQISHSKYGSRYFNLPHTCIKMSRSDHLIHSPPSIQQQTRWEPTPPLLRCELSLFSFSYPRHGEVWPYRCSMNTSRSAVQLGQIPSFRSWNKAGDRNQRRRLWRHQGLGMGNGRDILRFSPLLGVREV